MSVAAFPNSCLANLARQQEIRLANDKPLVVRVTSRKED
jgi:hypothetical protein